MLERRDLDREIKALAKDNLPDEFLKIEEMVKKSRKDLDYALSSRYHDATIEELSNSLRKHNEQIDKLLAERSMV